MHHAYAKFEVTSVGAAGSSYHLAQLVGGAVQLGECVCMCISNLFYLQYFSFWG